MKSIFIFLTFLTLYQLCYAYERVKLKDVQALTFHQGRYTIGRKPIAQLRYVWFDQNSFLQVRLMRFSIFQ